MKKHIRANVRPPSGRPRSRIWSWGILAPFLICGVAPPIARSGDEPPATGGGIGRTPLTGTPTGVLGGRLTVQMPRGARVEARPHDIMSAPEPEEHETRVVVDAGDERLVLLAKEMFALAGDDLGKDVRALVGEWEKRLKVKYRVEPLTLAAKGLRAVSVTPTNPPDRSRSDDAVFIEGVFVVSADQTIQSVDVYANPAAARDPAGCSALARQILRSVTPGGRKRQFEAGERRLFAWSGEGGVVVTVPEGMVVTTQRGPDFLVHRLIVLGRLGLDPGSVGVYLGNFPDFRPGKKKVEGVLLGKKVGWQEMPGVKGLETLCEHPLGEDFPATAHVWIVAEDDARLAALRRVAESMRVVKEPVPRAK